MRQKSTPFSKLGLQTDSKEKTTMRNGICFLAIGTSVIPTLVVALHSLRKHYTGEICVLTKDVPDFFLGQLKRVPGTIVDTKTVDMAFPSVEGWQSHMRLKIWCLKPLLHKLSPFDRTVFYDCDMVFENTFDMSLFSVLDQNQLACPTDMRLKRKRYRLGEECSNILNCKPFVLHAEGGCVASLKSSDHLFTWFGSAAMLAQKINRNPIDEYALSYVISNCGGVYVDKKWALGLHWLNELGNSPKGTIAVHCSRHRYSLSSAYKSELKEVLSNNFMDIGNEAYRGLDGEFDLAKSLA